MSNRGSFSWGDLPSAKLSGISEFGIWTWYIDGKLEWFKLAVPAMVQPIFLVV